MCAQLRAGWGSPPAGALVGLGGGTSRVPFLDARPVQAARCGRPAAAAAPPQSRALPCCDAQGEAQGGELAAQLHGLGPFIERCSFMTLPYSSQQGAESAAATGPLQGPGDARQAPPARQPARQPSLAPRWALCRSGLHMTLPGLPLPTFSVCVFLLPASLLREPTPPTQLPNPSPPHLPQCLRRQHDCQQLTR